MKPSVALTLLVMGSSLGSLQVGWADLVSYTYATVDVPGAIDTGASDINDTGQIVGFYTTPTFLGFVDSSGTFTTFAVPPMPPSFEAVDTFPSGINDGGRVVGTFETSSHIQHGFTLIGNSITVVDPPAAPIPRLMPSITVVKSSGTSLITPVRTAFWTRMEFSQLLTSLARRPP